MGQQPGNRPAAAQATADGLELPFLAAGASSTAAAAAAVGEPVSPAVPAFADATPAAAVAAAAACVPSAAADAPAPVAGQTAGTAPTASAQAVEALRAEDGQAARDHPAATATAQSATAQMPLLPSPPQQQQQQHLAATTVPLYQLQLSPQEPLRSATRHPCPSCKRTRAFFCYDCLLPLMDGMPNIQQLPVQVHIVMHGETNAQATGTHAAMLAPASVALFRHNDGTSHHRRQSASKLQLPEWDPKTTAVLYPEGPDTPVVGLWGVLEQAGWQQRQQQQRQQQQHKPECQQCGEHQCKVQERLACQQHEEQPCQQQQQQQQQELKCRQRGKQHCNAQQQAADRNYSIGNSCSVAGATDADSSYASGTLRTYGADGGSSSGSAGSSSSSSAQHPCTSFPYKTVVVLEGNWAKARTLLKHPNIAPLPRLQLPLNVRSLFWRRGTGSFRAAVDCGVCTIEAVYLLCRQLQPEPQAQWDDLLWLFSYQRQLVQKKGSYQTRCEMQQNFEAACGRV